MKYDIKEQDAHETGYRIGKFLRAYTNAGYRVDPDLLFEYVFCACRSGRAFRKVLRGIARYLFLEVSEVWHYLDQRGKDPIPWDIVELRCPL